MNLDDLYRILRRAPVQAKGVVDAVRDPLLVVDRDLCVVSANPAFFETFQVSSEETIGRSFYELGEGQWDIQDLRLLLEKVVPRSASITDFEVRRDFPGIGRRTMLISAQRLSLPDAASRLILLTIVDATECRRSDEEKDVLIGELRHRMKNFMALVKALARQTEAANRTGEEYRAAFLGRFDALVRAHEIAARKEPAQLDEIVRTTLEPYQADSAAVVVEAGPRVSLNPKQVLPMNLILHELATNAVKHGALSTPEGQVRINWYVIPQESGEGRILHLEWQERGGPPVSAPSARGFGSRLIKFAARQDLGGRVEQTFMPEGFSAEIVFSL